MLAGPIRLGHGLTMFSNQYISDNCDVVITKSSGKRICGNFLERGLNWYQTNETCATLGGQLPTITSEEENKDTIRSAVSSRTEV